MANARKTKRRTRRVPKLELEAVANKPRRGHRFYVTDIADGPTVIHEVSIGPLQGGRLREGAVLRGLHTSGRLYSTLEAAIFAACGLDRAEMRRIAREGF